MASASNEDRGSTANTQTAVQKVKSDAEAADDEWVQSITCDPLCSTDVEDAESYAEGYTPQDDLNKAFTLGMIVCVVMGLVRHEWVSTHSELVAIAVFVISYVGIIFEESLAYNKSGVALVMAVGLWVIRDIGAAPGVAVEELQTALADVSQVVFFLLGAMTIVETVDLHQGFKVVTAAITTRSPRRLLWILGGITFAMSAVLDNLTTTIVMISLLRKLVPDPQLRRVYGAAVVLAANAGGAWTPIGDVTTTMLWINGNISTFPTMRDLVLPSAVSVAIPLAILSFFDDVVTKAAEMPPQAPSAPLSTRGKLVFAVGVGALLFVPVFKSLTGLPPYLGMLQGLGVLWLLTDFIHFKEPEKDRIKVSSALTRIDTQGVVFFLGILLGVAGLEATGALTELATYLDTHLPGQEVVAAFIGLVSALIDNVPLVAATMGMYDSAMDSELWQLIAFCAGTGGSILIIGSASGVAFMGMEEASFMWYLRKITPAAVAGYLGGIGAYLLQHSLFTAQPDMLATLTPALQQLPMLQ